MNRQRAKRELDCSIRISRVSRQSRIEINEPLQRLPDAQPHLIITGNIFNQIAHWQAATGQRVFVNQIVRGVYRRIVDDGQRPTMLGALLALLLAMMSGYLVIYLAAVPDFVDLLQHSMLLLVAGLAALIGYTTIWLRFGASALYRIRRGAC